LSSIFATTKEDLVSNAEEFYESFHRAERQANEKVFYEIIAATPNYKKYYITENKTFISQELSRYTH
jgi:hypothetical protein